MNIQVLHFVCRNRQNYNSHGKVHSCVCAIYYGIVHREIDSITHWIGLSGNSIELMNDIYRTDGLFNQLNNDIHLNSNGQSAHSSCQVEKSIFRSHLLFMMCGYGGCMLIAIVRRDMLFNSTKCIVRDISYARILFIFYIYIRFFILSQTNIFERFVLASYTARHICFIYYNVH